MSVNVGVCVCVCGGGLKHYFTLRKGGPVEKLKLCNKLLSMKAKWLLTKSIMF